MAKIKHIALATQDPDKTAAFFKEVFGLSPGGYKKQNEFWRAHAIVSEIDALDPADAHPLKQQISRIGATYEQLSSMYQNQKGGAGIPLA